MLKSPASHDAVGSNAVIDTQYVTLSSLFNPVFDAAYTTFNTIGHCHDRLAKTECI